ncbi:MAG: hypothetical protein E7449_00425 [Ruminococcaceae bacterium]|nr:hypothetical protein [Oscillospiraceae bacterium]
MKRTYRLFALLVLLVLLLGITAQADLIDYRSYVNHSKHGCELYGRVHIMNAPEGAVKVYSEPDGKVKYYTSSEGRIEPGSLANGIRLKILCTLEDGEWGYVDYSTGIQLISGWIKLDQTILEYDGQSFLDEHKEALYPDDGTAISMLENVPRPFTYDYPGAVATFSKLMNAEEMVESNYVFEHLYKDKDGRIWGYLGTTPQGRDWVCLSEPTSKELPVVEYQTIQLYPASGEGAQSALTPAWILPTCLVAGVAALSLVLILVLKKKKSSG